MSLAEQLQVATEFVRENPEVARFVPSTTCILVGALAVKATVGAHEVTIDEPAAIGGEDSGPSPVEMALVSLGSCQAITYRLWAAKLGIRFDNLKVFVEGDHDARGILGLEGHRRLGFTDIRVTVTIEGPDADRYEELRAAVDEHCPVLDLFGSGAAVTTALG